MPVVIVAFLRQEDAVGIRRLLAKHGYDVTGTCTSGAQAVRLAGGLDGGIVLCGYRLSDMHYTELHDYLPEGFRMVLVASPARWRDGHAEDIVCVEMPVKAGDLLSVLEETDEKLRTERRARKERNRIHGRSEEDRALILRAKAELMKQNGMTEAEAHRYLQKISMESGNGLAEAAGMLLLLMKNGKGG